VFYLFIKVFITGLVVAGVSEIAKRSSLMAAVLASLPLTSLLALVWLYLDTSDAKAAASLSTSIFWMVLPSLFFFVAFPLLVKSGFRFYPALVCASILMIGVYWGYVQLLKRFGISL
jgi:hypothetical protein